MTDDRQDLAAARRRTSSVAFSAAAYIYLLIVFGAFVRISGSGLGCGDDWPNCNGEWLPAWDVTTWIEWGHRLLAAGAALPILLTAALAFRYRAAERIGATPMLRLSLGAVGLLVVQALLGAVTVKLELPPPVTIAHFIVASLLLASLLVIGIRGRDRAPSRAPRVITLPMVAAMLALAVIAWGAWTANDNASMACLGFPLCNGEVFPTGGNAAHTRAIHIHWVHRLLAYALVVVIGWGGMRMWRESMSRGVKAAGLAALVLVIGQAAVGAGLVTLMLPAALRALHVAVGMALWSSIVIWALLWRRSPTPQHSQTDTTVHSVRLLSVAGVIESYSNR